MLGLGAATLAGLDGRNVREVGEAIAKGGHALSSVASEVLEGIGNSSKVSSRFAEMATKSAAFAEGASKVLGRAAGVLDGFNALSALARGDGAQAGISAMSAAGAILSTTSRRAIGGAVGLAAAGLQLGYDIYRNVKERNMYEGQAASAFKAMGFNEDGANGLAAIRGDAGPILDALGHGVGPGGRPISRAEVLDQLKNFDAFDPRVLDRLNNVVDDMKPGDLSAPGTGASVRDIALRTLRRLQVRLFGRRAA